MQLKISESISMKEIPVLQAVALIFLMLHTLFTLVQYQLKLSTKHSWCNEVFKSYNCDKQ